MFIGINTNIQHKGETYHVQTEDGGLDQHTLTTILFKNGVILSSKKSSYLDVPKTAKYEETIKEKMQQQHKQMLRDLVRGKMDTGNGGPEAGSVMSEDQSVSPEAVPNEPDHTMHEKENHKGSAKEHEAPKKGLDALILEYLTQKEAEHA